jgi:hypothetical protein
MKQAPLTVKQNENDSHFLFIAPFLAAHCRCL